MVLAAVVAAACLATACGKKGPPRPPQPRGPLPPTAVAARQLGSRIRVAFDAPRPRGPDTTQQLARAELVRVEYAPGLDVSPDPDAFRRRGAVVAVYEGDALHSGARLRIEDPTWTRLDGGGVGWTLRYAVRIRDRRGRPSPLVVAADLVPVAPPPPPGHATAEATADGVRLVWEPPHGEGPFRYNVYRAVSGQPLGERPINGSPLTTPDYLDAAAEPGKIYQYAIRTAAADAPPYRESDSSPEVEVLAEDRFPPEAPRGLVAVHEGDAVRLFWDPNREKDLLGYRLYRSVESSAWERIGPDPITEPLFLDTDVRPGQRVEYRVTAVDRANPPNESVPSATVEVRIVPGGSGPAGTVPGPR